MLLNVAESFIPFNTQYVSAIIMTTERGHKLKSPNKGML